MTDLPDDQVRELTETCPMPGIRDWLLKQSLQRQREFHRRAAEIFNSGFQVSLRNT